MPRKTTGETMITDDPKEMEHRLTEYVRDAREALETLAELDPISEEDAHNRESRVNRRYVEALQKLNTSRVWLGMAAEQLHDLLNDYNDRMIYAGKETSDQDGDEEEDDGEE